MKGVYEYVKSQVAVVDNIGVRRRGEKPLELILKPI
jgi:hypothetical protein